MKKRFFTFCLGFCLSAATASQAQADLSPQQVRELYASTPFEAHDVYNRQRDIRFAELSAINGFFSTVFSKKVEKISSVKINYQPKMQGWTAMVFKAIYSPSLFGGELPAALSEPVKSFSKEIVSAVNDLKFEILRTDIYISVLPLTAILFFAFSILSIHKIKFRLFIQRE